MSKRGASMSAGVKGARVTAGTSGARVSAGVPGTGLGVMGKVGGAGREKEAAHDEQPLKRELSFEERQARIKAGVYAIGIVAAGIWWLLG